MSSIDRNESRNNYGFRDVHHIDRLIARTAEGQHGLVTRQQLGRLGLEQDDVDYRVRIGRFHRVHQGVFAVGHAGITREAGYLAAVLAVGDGAAAGSISALDLWAIRDPTRSELEEATVAFLNAHGFPPFETNHRIERDEVDVAWPAQRLVIEADGGAFHDNPIARADDEAKQARLEAVSRK
jgi:hypothetical protein